MSVKKNMRKKDTNKNEMSEKGMYAKMKLERKRNGNENEV